MDNNFAEICKAHREYSGRRFDELIAEIRKNREEHNRNWEKVEKFLFTGNGNKPADVRLALLESWKKVIVKLSWIVLPLLLSGIGYLVVDRLF